MNLLRQILEAGRASGASDIHLKPGRTPVFRIDQEIVRADEPVLSAEGIEEILAEAVSPEMRERFDRERELDFSYDAGKAGRFRVNLYVQRGQPCVAMRHVKATVPTFESLGLPSPLMTRLGSERTGLILFAGTTGAGKSTSLASLIGWINVNHRKHIVMIEDPIEFLFEDKESVIAQREIGLDTLDFGSALQHVIRQDPDIIVIGEMRDAESFRAGVAASNTGHLVLATLHSSDVRQAVERVLDFFTGSERDQIRRQLGLVMRAIVCQRLVPGAGGGIHPALEVLRTSETVRQLFFKNEIDKLNLVMQQSQAEGMQTFDQALATLTEDGRITQETALAFASNPEQLRMAFRGFETTMSKLIE